MDTVDDQAIPKGAASRCLNWLSMGDRWELRRGMVLLGNDYGAGKVLGLGVGVMADGTEIPYKKVGRKLLRYNSTTQLWTEVGSNLFPAAATNDECSFATYSSLAGAQLFFSSPNSGLYKIMTANPDDYTDLTDAAKNFKGYINILFSRIRLWGRIADPSGIYGTYIDGQQYTTVTGEATTSLTGTLAFKGGGTKRTCFAVAITITASGEVYTDDYNGVLTGSLGGTGTINYTTGAYTVSAAGVGTATYQWEDSTNQGLADFTKSGTRTAGQGFVFRQDDGGKAQAVESYGDSDFCLHEKKTYELKLTNTDTAATNLPFRDKVGIPNWRAAKGTGDGVYLVDDTDKTDPQFRLMSLDPMSSKVLPKSISKRATRQGVVLGVELSAYEFDQAVIEEWGDYVLFGVRRASSTVNDRLFVYSKKTGAIIPTTFSPSCLANYDGSLIMGDSITGNVYILFSSWTDDDSDIENYLELDLSDLDIEELKKTKRLILKGKISPDQAYDVYINLDNSGYTKVGTIAGTGSYVDLGQSITIGSTMVGEVVVGGGSDGTTAYYYEHALRLSLDKFHRAKLKFVATGVGYVSIDGYEWFDIRLKGKKILSKYR